jgi:hypothetical protein
MDSALLYFGISNLHFGHINLEEIEKEDQDDT